MLDEHGFGHHGTGAAGTGESGDGRQQMQKQDGQIAHRTILARSRHPQEMLTNLEFALDSPPARSTAPSCPSAPAGLVSRACRADAASRASAARRRRRWSSARRSTTGRSVGSFQRQCLAGDEEGHLVDGGSDRRVEPSQLVAEHGGRTASPGPHLALPRWRPGRRGPVWCAAPPAAR